MSKGQKQRAVGLWVSLLAVASLLVPCIAGAVESGSVGATLNSDGTGELSASSQTNPAGESWSWQVCSAGSEECMPFATGRTASTSGAHSNVVFRASSSEGVVAVSPLWMGTVTAASLPSVKGSVRANALVTPVDGTWNGGWAGDFDQTQLSACAQSNGQECTTLTDPNYGGCPGGGAVIDPVFTGWYLRVADKTLGPNTATPAIAYSSPYGHEVWSAGATVAVAVVGQIAAATGGRESNCGPPPLPKGSDPHHPGSLMPPGELPTKAHPTRAMYRAKIASDGVATVSCSKACHVTFSARSGSLRRTIARRLRRAGTIKIHFSPRAMRTLGHHRRALLTLKINGGIYARRTLAFR